MNLKTIVFLFSTVTSFDLFSQEKKDTLKQKQDFNISAEIRTRGNVFNSYKKLPTATTDASYVIEQRTRLGFGYKNKILQMQITLQDSRIWGDENIVTKTGVFGDSASVDLQQAWAALQMGNYWKFKVGRQVLHLDDGRLVSNRNWLNQGLSYDAAVIKYNNNGFNLDIALSYNNSALNLFAGEYDPDKMKSLDYVYLRKNFNKNFTGSFSAIFAGYQPENEVSKIRFKNTIGPYLKYNNNKLFAKGEFYYQFGKTIDNVDVSAYFFNAETGYRINKFYFGAGIDYMSGQDTETPLNETFQAFDVLYGARFKYYGNLNYVLTPASTKYGGLMNPFFKFDVKFNKNHILKTTFLMLYTAQDVPDATSPGSFYDRNLGQELDMMYIYKITPDIFIKAGYHIAFPTETMEILKGVEPGTSNTPQWFWVMFSFKPTLFSTK
ncbi:MAG: alginate export family protein [Chlorobi bacterium]|nr:alginate export family protein [Chlorobiota bacterium]